MSHDINHRDDEFDQQEYEKNVDICGHQLTESERDYYDNRPALLRLCKRCAMEEKTR